MLRGSVVEDQQTVTSGNVLKIKPPTGEEWAIHNIYVSGDAALIKCKLYTVTNEPVGTGDNATTIFTLAQTPVEEYSETIYLNGTPQTRNTDYTIDYETGTITFSTAPGSNVSITADYQYRVEVTFDTSSGTGGWGYYAFHLTSTNYLRVKNISTSSIIIGYDGIVTGPI